MPFMLGAAGISTLGSLFGGLFGSHAAHQAQTAQQTAAHDEMGVNEKVLEAQTGAYSKNLGDQTNLYNPYIDTGHGALNQLNALTAAGGFQAPTGVTMQNDPGYQFRMQEGQKALEQSAAARGTSLGGGELKELTQYGQNFGSNEYQNVYNRALGTYQTNFGNLENLAGMGLNATNQLNTDLSLNAAGTAGAYGNYGQNMNNAWAGYGNAGAAGAVGSANALGGALGNVGNNISQMLLLQQLLGGGGFGGGGGDTLVSPGFTSGGLPGSVTP